MYDYEFLLIYALHWPAFSSKNGAFSQYVVARAELCLAIPDKWSFEDAAQLPMATFTASQTLYQSLRFPTPPERAVQQPIPILVYGGTSAVGGFVVQYAKLSGFKVYATASPKNFEFVKKFGADEVYDYKDPDSPKKIKEATGGQLEYAVDTISVHGSGKFISDAFSDFGGKIAVVLDYEPPRTNITVVRSIVFDFLVEVSVFMT
jgi:NADPH:quinone reductase-like Zn-dependent oxidoreductase